MAADHKNLYLTPIYIRFYRHHAPEVSFEEVENASNQVCCHLVIQNGKDVTIGAYVNDLPIMTPGKIFVQPQSSYYQHISKTSDITPKQNDLPSSKNNSYASNASRRTLRRRHQRRRKAAQNRASVLSSAKLSNEMKANNPRNPSGKLQNIAVRLFIDAWKHMQDKGTYPLHLFRNTAINYDCSISAIHACVFGTTYGNLLNRFRSKIHEYPYLNRSEMENLFTHPSYCALGLKIVE